jgi:hypothetical protein
MDNYARWKALSDMYDNYKAHDNKAIVPAAARGAALTTGQKWALGLGIPATYLSLAAGQQPEHNDWAIPALGAAAASALGTYGAYKYFAAPQGSGNGPMGGTSDLHIGYADTGPPRNPTPVRYAPQRSPCTPGMNFLEIGLAHGGNRGRSGYVKQKCVVSHK